MIDLYDAQITDILPDALKEDVEVRCLSYAISEELKRLQDKAKNIILYAGISELPESLLDVMAVELQTPYYDSSFDVETKRELVSKSRYWHKIAGTPQAVKELAEAIFGTCEVVEWFRPDFGGEVTTGQFDVRTSAPPQQATITYFNAILEKQKNARSHLRRIIQTSEINSVKHYACGFHSRMRSVIS